MSAGDPIKRERDPIRNASDPIKTAGDPIKSVASVWIFHRGALGDSILLWPLMRALRRKKMAVTLVSDASKGALAQQELSVRAVSAELRRFSDLWVTGAAKEPGRLPPLSGVSRVLSFVVVQGKDLTWAENARAMFPGAHLEVYDTQLDRRLALELAEREAIAFDPPIVVPAPEAPIIFHIGAGSRIKRWPIKNWIEVINRLHKLHPELPVQVVAGEAEEEQFSREQVAAFDQLGGRFIGALPDLCEVLRAARLVVIADSGPAHLAAQLGISTLTLFGPTVPGRWSPIGPAVRVVAPDVPSAMDWLRPDQVVHEIEHTLLHSAAGAPPGFTLREPL